MKENNRYYSFRIVTYAEEEEFKNLLKYADKWEWICHDKDKNEDGSLRDKHYHINVILRQWRSVKSVCELVKSEQNTFAIPMLDKKEAHEYLIHKNNPEKYQYDTKEIHESAKRLFEDKESKKEENENLIEILSSIKTYREKAIILGKDYMKNFDKYEKFINLMQEQEISLERGYNINHIQTMTIDDFIFDYETSRHEAWVRNRRRLQNPSDYEEIIKLIKPRDQINLDEIIAREQE